MEPDSTIKNYVARFPNLLKRPSAVLTKSLSASRGNGLTPWIAKGIRGVWSRQTTLKVGISLEPRRNIKKTGLIINRLTERLENSWKAHQLVERLHTALQTERWGCRWMPFVLS